MRLLVLLSLSLILIVGCNQSAKVKKNDISQQSPLEVAGRWKAVGQPCEITLSRDGKVLSAVVAMGAVEIKPNEVTKVEMIDGQFSTYKAGDCTVEYDSAGKVLVVSIVLEYLDIKIGADGFEGSSIEVFTGPVSADGKKWHTIWENVFDYGERFPMDPNDMGRPLEFVKVDTP